ncbi:MAG: type II toxin-antitoxin system RelE/ParE family toxin [Alistipes sp.]|nr:type II toxin-antitoxin system RelE/ParE family toxin [Alistipes sp.]
MVDQKYALRYLPLFYDDFEEKITYIADKLLNPKAANNLIDAVEQAIMERLPVAEAFEPYRSQRDRKNLYYRIYVGNYVVYYVVIDGEGADKIMEIRRFLYKGQDYGSLL